jgi:coenzyme F420 hydrogenase subunit beta
MSAAKKSGFEETLQEKVILKEICSGCEACILVCPFGCLEYFEERPNLIKKCEICGICPRTCPRYDFPQATLEKMVYGRERGPSEDFGVYRRSVIAQAADDKIRGVGQDGGMVSALLIYALNNGIIDSAVVSMMSREKPWFPLPKLVSTAEEVLECAGTRYMYSPNLLALREAVKQKRKSVAFVGTPCQIQAIRKIEAFPLKKFSSLIKFTVGLMCTESFTYDGLVEKHIRGVLGVDPNDITKMNIKGKILVTTKSSGTKTISLHEAKQYTRKGCLPCTDFSSELADISGGGLGLNGWTFTVIRTKTGEEVFDNAVKAGAIKSRPVEEEMGSLDLLTRLSKRKRKAGSKQV